MAFNTIETPGMPNGDEQQQIEQMYNYLLRLSQDLNINLEMIGNNDLTDDERQAMSQILTAAGTQKAEAGSTEAGLTEMESLKSLIIKTAKFVQTKLDEYRLNLVRESVAEGNFGKYVRNTKLDLEVTPEGITQEYKFSEAVNGIKDYELNTKAYIKSGLLRTVDNVPVYGVAIGQGVVSFNNDGSEVYNDGNKVAELTEDELSFWQNGTKIASYKGDRIGFYYGSDEVFYISQGKIYCAKDFKIMSGGAFEVDATNFKISSADKCMIAGDWRFSDGGLYWYYPDAITGEMEEVGLVASSGQASLFTHSKDGVYNGLTFSGQTIAPYEPGTSLGFSVNRFNYVYANYFDGQLVNSSSRAVKHDIQPMPEMGRRLDRLQPVTFVYNGDKAGRTRYGLIYEDTVGVMPEICTDGGQPAINYVELVPMLLKEIQELRARIRALEEIQEG